MLGTVSGEQDPETFLGALGLLASFHIRPGDRRDVEPGVTKWTRKTCRMLSFFSIVSGPSSVCVGNSKVGGPPGFTQLEIETKRFFRDRNRIFFCRSHGP